MGAFAAALLAFAISALFAPVVRYAVDFLGYAILLTALYLLFVRVWTSRAIALRLEVLLIAGCFAAGILFVAAMVNLWATMWTAHRALRRPAVALRVRRPVDRYAERAGRVPGAALLRRRHGARRTRPPGRLAAVALGVIVAVDVALSASRGAWLGVGIAIIVTGIAWLVTTDRPRSGEPGNAPGQAAAAWWCRHGSRGARRDRHRDRRRPAAPHRDRWRGRSRNADRSIGADVPGGSADWARPGEPGARPARVHGRIGDRLLHPPRHNVPAQTLAEFGLVGIIAAGVVVALVLRLIGSGLRGGFGPARIWRSRRCSPALHRRAAARRRLDPSAGDLVRAGCADRAAGRRHAAARPSVGGVRSVAGS